MIPSFSEEKGLCILKLDAAWGQEVWMELRALTHQSCWNERSSHVVMDASAVAELPSIALGVFCSLSRDAITQQARFHVVGMSERDEVILKRIHADHLIPRAASIEALMAGEDSEA